MFSSRKALTVAVKTSVGLDMGLTMPGQLKFMLKSNLRFFSAGNTLFEPIKLLDLAFQEYRARRSTSRSIPIIIMHGLLGCRMNWNYTAKSFVNNISDRNVITVDARNHGDSPHSDQFTLLLMMYDLVQLLSKQGISRASFIGHGIGGRVCMVLAKMYPQFVEDLVIVNTSPVNHSLNMTECPKIFHAIKGINLPSHLSVSEARRHAAMLLGARLKDDTLVGLLIANIVENRFEAGWRWRFNIDAITKNYQKEILPFPSFSSECEIRTMFVSGEKSNYVREEHIPAMQEFFPNSRFIFVQGTGHLLFLDKPQQFLDIVTEFLVNVKIV